MTPLNEFDIVIVGAGLVGTSVVVGLQNAGFRILVLEKHLPTIIEAAQEDRRPLTLACGSQLCLHRWGIWSELASAAMPIQTLHVSEQGRLGRVQFLAKQLNVSALGYVVPFSLLQRTLYESASSQSNVEFTSIEKIHSLVCQDDGVTIDYVAADKRHQVLAKLLIAADGTHSTCRQLLNISVEEDDAKDVALIASFHCGASHQNKAYQRFTHQGSMALLPLFDRHQYRLVWTMPHSLYQKVTDWPAQKLLATVDAAYGGRLEKISQWQHDAVFPLQTIIACEIVRPSVVLLGNAAHTIYPIAAQGFNLGVQDVAVLTQVLMHAQQHDESIGALSTLTRYVKRREKNQRAVIQWTKRITDVFHWRIPLFDHARGMALLCLDTFPFVKENFVRNFLHG